VASWLLPRIAAGSCATTPPCWCATQFLQRCLPCPPGTSTRMPGSIGLASCSRQGLRCCHLRVPAVAPGDEAHHAPARASCAASEPHPHIQLPACRRPWAPASNINAVRLHAAGAQLPMAVSAPVFLADLQAVNQTAAAGVTGRSLSNRAIQVWQLLAAWQRLQAGRVACVVSQRLRRQRLAGCPARLPAAACLPAGRPCRTTQPQ